MDEIRAELSRYPVKTRLALSGPMIVARDIAHAKLKERLDRGEGLPQYLQGPPRSTTPVRPRRPQGYASGSFGPTTAGRMDCYVDLFQAARRQRRHARQGQPLAGGDRRLQAPRRLLPRLDRRPGRRPGAGEHQAVEVLEYPELGMEAIWKIEVEDFPAFILVDDKGNDFFQTVSRPVDLKV